VYWASFKSFLNPPLKRNTNVYKQDVREWKSRKLTNLKLFSMTEDIKCEERIESKQKEEKEADETSTEEPMEE